MAIATNEKKAFYERNILVAPPITGLTHLFAFQFDAV
jgi:hypothetical protein